MAGHLGFLDATFHNFFSRISNEITVLSGTVAAFVLLFCIFIVINHFRSKKILEKAAIEIDGANGESESELSDLSGPVSLQFVEGLLASARSQNVPLAPLQTILAKLIDAGIPSTKIPERLQRAAAELVTLRSSLANWEDEGPDHAQIRTETLALIDRGDFEAASEVLKRGRETGWTFPMATCREEAEYHAREAMIDHLQLRFCAAADGYAAAAALVADDGGIDVWRHLTAQAHELCADGCAFGTRHNVLRAIEIYHRALGLAGREKMPLEWAATQHHLGGALLRLGESEKDTGALREAVDAYLSALEEWTFEHAPADWTKSQIDLGNALKLLGEQESDPERLRQSAEAYRALAEHTLETAPFDWAGVCNRLGDTLAALGIEDGGDRERLAEAIDAYREALNGIDPDRALTTWVATQNSFGRALEALGEEAGGTGFLHQAVAAYQTVLDERCRDLAPSDLAATNTNLGHALVTIAERENDTAYLEEAAAAYRAVLEARQANEAPLDTARSHIKLACAVGGLWNRTRNRHMLDEALAAVEAALSLIDEMPEHSAAVLAPERTVAATGH